MISRELSKELKQQGFPYEEYQKTGGVCIHGLSSSDKHLHDPTGTLCKWPDDYFWIFTLSELIEACGDAFGALELASVIEDPERKGVWKVWRRFAQDVISDIPYTAPTPESAVARLWLELNKR